MADIEDAEATQAVYVFFAVDVAIRVRPRVRPFDCGSCVLERCCLAVFEKPRIHMIAERLDGFTRDPIDVVRRYLRFCNKI